MVPGASFLLCGFVFVIGVLIASFPLPVSCVRFIFVLEHTHCPLGLPLLDIFSLFERESCHFTAQIPFFIFFDVVLPSSLGFFSSTDAASQSHRFACTEAGLRWCFYFSGLILLEFGRWVNISHYGRCLRWCDASLYLCVSLCVFSILPLLVVFIGYSNLRRDSCLSPHFQLGGN